MNARGVIEIEIKDVNVLTRAVDDNTRWRKIETGALLCTWLGLLLGLLVSRC